MLTLFSTVPSQTSFNHFIGKGSLKNLQLVRGRDGPKPSFSNSSCNTSMLVLDVPQVPLSPQESLLFTQPAAPALGPERLTDIEILTLLLGSCVSAGKPLHLSGFQVVRV